MGEEYYPTSGYEYYRILVARDTPPSDPRPSTMFVSSNNGAGMQVTGADSDGDDILRQRVRTI
jgi:hypothetical protein